MTAIHTERLTIEPTHTNCWAVYDSFDQQLVGKLFFRKHWFNIILKPQSLGLGVATEASYHLLKALNSPHYKARTTVPHAQQFLLNLGFEPQDNHFSAKSNTLNCPNLYQQTNQMLGIASEPITHPRHQTAVQLVDAGVDCFGRPAKLHPQANSAWHSMQQAALADNIDLQLVSAYRSIKYQAQLIQNKLEKGQKLDEILHTNTAPGHSEHHTGRALDLTSPGFKPLEEVFETSPAFSWLMQNAESHGFYLSYPKNNPYGIIYEPWHWCYHHQKS